MKPRSQLALVTYRAVKVARAGAGLVVAFSVGLGTALVFVGVTVAVAVTVGDALVGDGEGDRLADGDGDGATGSGDSTTGATEVGSGSGRCTISGTWGSAAAGPTDRTATQDTRTTSRVAAPAMRLYRRRGKTVLCLPGNGGPFARRGGPRGHYPSVHALATAAHGPVDLFLG